MPLGRLWKTTTSHNSAALDSQGYSCGMQGYGGFPFLRNTAARQKKKKEFKMCSQFENGRFIPPTSYIWLGIQALEQRS